MALPAPHKITRQLASFGAIGVAAYAVDVALFNLLSSAPSPLHDSVITAKALSSLVAMAVSFLGNRTWTFPGSRHNHWHQIGRFLLANIGGIAITLATLAVSHYVLGFTSALADNISGNIIGVGLGTAFRFWAYRTWVFTPAAGQTAAGQTVAGRAEPGTVTTH